MRAHLRTSLGFSPPEPSFPTSGHALWVAMPTLAPFGGSTCVPAWVSGSFEASGSAGPSPDCRLSWGSAPSDRHGAPHIVPGSGPHGLASHGPVLAHEHRALSSLVGDATEDPGPSARRRRPFGARRAASSIRQRLFVKEPSLRTPRLARSGEEKATSGPCPLHLFTRRSFPSPELCRTTGCVRGFPIVRIDSTNGPSRRLGSARHDPAVEPAWRVVGTRVAPWACAVGSGWTTVGNPVAHAFRASSPRELHGADRSPVLAEVLPLEAVHLHLVVEGAAVEPGVLGGAPEVALVAAE